MDGGFEEIGGLSAEKHFAYQLKPGDRLEGGGNLGWGTHKEMVFQPGSMIKRERDKSLTHGSLDPSPIPNTRAGTWGLGEKD